MLRLSLILTLVLLTGGSAAYAQEIVRHPDAGQALTARWDWAVRTAPSDARGGFWIGYSIERWMHEGSFIGSWSRGDEDEPTLGDLLEGRAVPPRAGSDEDAVLRAAERALGRGGEDERSERRVRKEVALLFEMAPDGRTVRGVSATNLTRPFDLEGRPLYWLGPAGDAESLALLKARYDRAREAEARERLVTAVGLHGDAGRVVPLLAGILKDDAAGDVREQAAFWLSQQDDPAVLDLLLRAAREDRDSSVREKAVFAVSQVEGEASTEALIVLARRERDREVREKAVFWLGQQASRKAVEALTGFAHEGDDEEIQKAAVFALSQLPDGGGVTRLIHLARTHPRPGVRKQAIFWLGQSEDPRALEVLVELARGQ